MRKETQRIHFIAIGGAVMHDLAIFLKNAGHQVSGSDDEIYNPARANLQRAELLPEAEGWFPEKITGELNAVILGMHAKKDNPELARARELGVTVYSYPEYIFSQCIDKQRVVIAGSHGKTSVTAMIIHVLNALGKSFDYVIGAKVNGLNSTVKLSNAPVVIIEGDEYPSSPTDAQPKFLHYNHHIGVINGISWDHFNVYRTYDEYVKQFELFADATPKAGSLIYNEEDNMTLVICNKERPDVMRFPFTAHEHRIKDGVTLLKGTGPDEEIPVKFFGYHNMQNVRAAQEVCRRVGVTDKQFYQAIRSFEGASRRLELLKENDHSVVYNDFAHAPSKLEATCRAVKEQYPSRKLVACLELHTFSSLNKDFMNQYQDRFEHADTAMVVYDPGKVQQKGLPHILPDEVKKAFNRSDLKVYTNMNAVTADLEAINWKNKNLLLMSSGNFMGTDINALANKLIG